VTYTLIRGAGGVVHASVDCASLPRAVDLLQSRGISRLEALAVCRYDVSEVEDSGQVRDLGLAACRLCAWEPAADLVLAGQGTGQRTTLVIFKRSKPYAGARRRRASGPAWDLLRTGALASLTRLAELHGLHLVDGEGAPVLYGHVTSRCAQELGDLCATVVIPDHAQLPAPGMVRTFLAVARATTGSTQDLWAAASELCAPPANGPVGAR